MEEDLTIAIKLGEYKKSKQDRPFPTTARTFTYTPTLPPVLPSHTHKHIHIHVHSCTSSPLFFQLNMLLEAGEPWRSLLLGDLPRTKQGQITRDVP